MAAALVCSQFSEFFFSRSLLCFKIETQIPLTIFIFNLSLAFKDNLCARVLFCECVCVCASVCSTKSYGIMTKYLDIYDV